MIRQYLGRFALVAFVVGLLGLAWGLKGTQFGQDLAGGAELRYGVSQRVTELYDRMLRYLAERSDPANVKAKRERIAEIEEELKTATGDERVKLENKKADLEFQLDEMAVREQLEDIDEQL